jgi:hypothetical protein
MEISNPIHKTLGEGRGNAFIEFLKGRRTGDCEMLETPEKIRELQRKLYQKAKREKGFRFYLLYDKVYRRDILSHAYGLVRANQGAPGVDGETFEEIEGREGGAQGYLEGVGEELRGKSYNPMPVRRVYIPKSDGGLINESLLILISCLSINQLAKPVPPHRRLLAVPGPVNGKGFSQDILQGHEPPKTTVKAVIPIVSHNE